MWVRTTWVHIQNDTWYDVCILILLNICMQRGSKCEHSQGHKQVWECTARVDIPTYPWYDSWYMYTCEYMYVCKEVLTVSTRRVTIICQLAQHGSMYKSICDGIMYTCEHMYVCKEVLSASTRRGTDICEFAQHGFTYKSICDMIYVYFWVYACIQRSSNCEHSQGHKHMWVRTTRVHIQN